MENPSSHQAQLARCESHEDDCHNVWPSKTWKGQDHEDFFADINRGCIRQDDGSPAFIINPDWEAVEPDAATTTATATTATAATADAATAATATFPMQPDSSSSSEGDEPPSAAQLQQEEEKALACQEHDQEQIDEDLGLCGDAASASVESSKRVLQDMTIKRKVLGVQLDEGNVNCEAGAVLKQPDLHSDQEGNVKVSIETRGAVSAGDVAEINFKIVQPQRVPGTPAAIGTIAPATPSTPSTPATPATPATPGTPPTPVAWNTRAAGGATVERDMVEEFFGNVVSHFGKDITTNHPLHSAHPLCKEMRGESDDDEGQRPPSHVICRADQTGPTLELATPRWSRRLTFTFLFFLINEG